MSAPYKTLIVPNQITALTFGHSGHLCAGSNDGSIRIYSLSTYKVLRAITSLGDEVSSIVCTKRPGSDFRDIWAAVGQYIYYFRMADMPSEKMLLTASDATTKVRICQDEDVLNELALDDAKKHVAFSTDAGHVGVLNLADLTITKMKTSHESVCGTVKFVPERPRELVSAGYDQNMHHYDWPLQSLILKTTIPTDPEAATGQTTLAPPFLMCTAISSLGVYAVGTADGRIFVGLGGQKHPGSKKKKRWGGLSVNESITVRAAEGPVVAIQFLWEDRFLTSSLMGVLKIFKLKPEGGVVTEISMAWEGKTNTIEKVNCIATDDFKFVVGGLSKEGKGVIEIFGTPGTI